MDPSERWPLSWEIADDAMALASEYIEERIHPSDRNAVDLAVRDMGGFRVTKEDWCRYADRNKLCKRIERAWISRNAEGLDMSAIEASCVAGFEVSIEDLVTHMLAFPDGKSWEYVSPRAKEIRERYTELTGRPLDLRSAKRLFDVAALKPKLGLSDCPF